MRFVSIKEIEQQDIQSIHRMRSLTVDRRTALVNQIRGLLMEFGIDIPKGRRNISTALPFILEDAENGLSHLFREELAGLYRDLQYLDDRVLHYDQKIALLAQNNEQAKLLMTIPGVGPIIATALLATIGSIGSFQNGRQLAAWLGLTPKQYSTGGKQTLLGISKRGDVYLRKLLIHGARSVLKWVDKKEDSTSVWAKSIKQRRNFNVASVAMANKMARVAYALLSRGEQFQVQTVEASA
jgi:transposase